MEERALGVITAHTRPDQHFTLLPGRETGENLLNGRRLRSHEGVILGIPGGDVGEEVSVEFSLRPLVGMASFNELLGEVRGGEAGKVCPMGPPSLSGRRAYTPSDRVRDR